MLTETKEPSPISEAEFAILMDRLAPFERRPTLAVAVSGGPDSLALTCLAARWATSRDGRVIGLTVDHDLRAESSKEADQTAAWLSKHGIDHHTLRWTGPKPTSGLQQKARNARYDLLLAWCRDAAVLHLLTGHHREDQAETVALRKEKQSGPDGLAGMAMIRDLPHLRLLRPFLGTGKARLIATLRHLEQPWVDDPSNRNPVFTRNRLRRDGIDLELLSAEARLRGRERALAEKRLQAVLAEIVSVDPAGFASAPDRAFLDQPPDIGGSLLARVLMTIGGGAYPPRSKRLQSLLDAMRGDQHFQGRTLYHCQVLKQQGRWFFFREANDTTTQALPPGQWLLWDDRFLVRWWGPDKDYRIQALGGHGWSKRQGLIESGRMRHIPAALRASLPSICQGDQPVAIPHLGLFAPSFDKGGLELHFKPKTPLANVPFAAHM